MIVFDLLFHVLRVRCFAYDEEGDFLDIDNDNNDLYNGPMTEDYQGFPRLQVKLVKRILNH